MKEQEEGLGVDQFEGICQQLDVGFDLMRLSEKVILQLSIPQSQRLFEVAQKKENPVVLKELEHWFSLMSSDPPNDIVSAPIDGTWTVRHKE